MKLWLIVEYGGRLTFNGWYIPNHHHGGIYPGPYATPEEASAALSKYAEKDSKAYEPQGSPHEIWLFEQREFNRIFEAHRVIEVQWPDERHPDDPET